MLVVIAYLSISFIALTSFTQKEYIVKLITGIMLVLCFNISVFHTLTTAVERFYAVTWPLRYRAVMTKEKTFKVILGIWVLLISIVTCFVFPDILKLSMSLRYYKGVIVIGGEIVVVLSYGCISYSLSKRDEFISSAVVRQNETNGMRERKQLRDAIFIYAIGISYVLCSLLCGIVMFCRIKNPDCAKIAKLLLVFNSLINTLLYFWRGNYKKRQRGRHFEGGNQENHAVIMVQRM